MFIYDHMSNTKRGYWWESCALFPTSSGDNLSRKHVRPFDHHHRVAERSVVCNLPGIPVSGPPRCVARAMYHARRRRWAQALFLLGGVGRLVAGQDQVRWSFAYAHFQYFLPPFPSILRVRYIMGVLTSLFLQGGRFDIVRVVL